MLNEIASATVQPPVISSPTLAELEAVKARQRATWASGDFGIIGTTLQIVGESLCEAVDLRAGCEGARRRGRQRQLPRWRPPAAGAR